MKTSSFMDSLGGVELLPFANISPEHPICSLGQRGQKQTNFVESK